MRSVYAFLIAASAGVLFVSNARADILVTIDKSAQRMTVSKDGQVLYRWPVSTGAPRYSTPSGSYTAFRMEADHFSKEWDDAPMPYSIFFTKVGHAIHGTYSKNIGMPVSHGCVRLSVAHAKQLYAMVQQEGVLKTKVVLAGDERIALKRGHTRMAREENPSDNQPRYGGQRYGDQRYGDQRDSDQGNDDEQYADRRYGYGGFPSYGPARDYRPQPQYPYQQQYEQPQSQYQQPYDPYRNRYGIY
jgi:hypothetical protein